MALRNVSYLSEVIPGIGRGGAYRLAREHPEFVVAIGRRKYVDDIKLARFLDAGGKALPVASRGKPTPAPDCTRTSRAAS